MVAITVPNRPFSTHPATGLMMPDGIFEASIGVQEINAQFRNDGGGLPPGTVVYLEAVSHPSITVVPRTFPIGSLPAGGTRVLAWSADFTNTPAGTYLVSFVMHDPAGGISRQIKKIFVTRLTFDPTTVTFTADTPEGQLAVTLDDLIGPADVRCERRDRDPRLSEYEVEHDSFLDLARRFYSQTDPSGLVSCLPGYLPHRIRTVLASNPPYPGQYGDLPFQDPLWKLILCLIVVTLLIAAAAVEANSGTGEVTVTTGSPDPAGGSTPNCCGVTPSGTGSDAVAAGLVGAAGIVALVTAFTDIRDPIRRGQDETNPPAGELTVGEEVTAKMIPNGPLTLGTPFEMAVEWTYQRTTSSGTVLTHQVDEITSNVHVLSRYDIDAPDVVDSSNREPFIVHGQFFDADGRRLSGGELFVQCYLIGPTGQWRRFPMLDDGIRPDEQPNDGVYTGIYDFHVKEDELGTWTYFVIAQDVNTAQPDMTPDEAAQIIGGIVLTHQLTINVGGGDCPLVPDGHVNVV